MEWYLPVIWAALIGVAVAFFAWAWLRPVPVEETSADERSTTDD